MPPPNGSSLPAVTALMERARAVTGGGDWEDRSFLPNLDLLLRSCDATARLNPRGQQVLDRIVVRHLGNRLLVEAEAAARPEAAAAPLGPAIVITGLPRTGTTLLHNLMALDPALRHLRVWEALRPAPPGGEGDTSEPALVRRAETWLERLYEMVPGFRAIHAVTAEGPEECDVLLQNEFASQHFDDMFDAQAYSDWFAMAPLLREYRSYVRQLGVLRGPDEGRTRPWVLKSPGHLGHLDALLAAAPEATVVHCHRHPFEAVPSYASLVLTLRRGYSDEVSPAAVGRQALRRSQIALSRAWALRREVRSRFVDVAYEDLVHRPLPTVAALYEQLGRPLRPEVAGSMSAWLADHPRHGHGEHRYELAHFDLTPAVVGRAFSRYLDGRLPGLV